MTEISGEFLDETERRIDVTLEDMARAISETVRYEPIRDRIDFAGTTFDEAWLGGRE